MHLMWDNLKNKSKEQEKQITIRTKGDAREEKKRAKQKLC